MPDITVDSVIKVLKSKMNEKQGKIFEKHITKNIGDNIQAAIDAGLVTDTTFDEIPGEDGRINGTTLNINPSIFKDGALVAQTIAHEIDHALFRKWESERVREFIQTSLPAPENRVNFFKSSNNNTQTIYQLASIKLADEANSRVREWNNFVDYMAKTNHEPNKDNIVSLFLAYKNSSDKPGDAAQIFALFFDPNTNKMLFHLEENGKIAITNGTSLDPINMPIMYAQLTKVFDGNT